MPATFTLPLITVIPGQTITASLWNNEFENIDTNFIPAGMDDASGTDTEMRDTEDPYPASATSRPTSLLGELKRIRYILAQLSGETYWYIDPVVGISTFKTRFDAHTHDGTANNGPQIQAAGLASDSVITAKILDSNVTTAKIADSNVTTAKIADSNVTTAKIADSNVTTAKIAAAAVDETKLAASVAGNGLSGGAGTALSVAVDDSTIEINSDTVRVKDAGITQAKLATAVVNQLGQNIGLVALSTSNVSYSGQGRLRGICSSGSCTVSIVIDGVTVVSGASLTTGQCVIWSTAGLSGGTGSLASLDIHFRTSLSVTKDGGAGTMTVAYERAA